MKRSANPEGRDVAPAYSQAQRVRYQATVDQYYFARPVTSRPAPREVPKQQEATEQPKAIKQQQATKQEATKQQPSASFKALPIEVLDQICDYLHEDDDVASIAAFALACKACHEAAKHILVRTIKFRICQSRRYSDDDYADEPVVHVEMFHRDVQICSEALHRDGTLNSVRRLILDDMLDWDPSSSGSREMWQQPRLNDYEKRKDEADLDGYLSYPKSKPGAVHCLPKSHSAKLDAEDIWAPLVALVRKLSVLTDVYFGCSAPFPRWLLRALHEKPTTCRLWIRNFRLHSSDEMLRRGTCLSDVDLELATSPCLYGVRCWYAQTGFKEDRELASSVMRMRAVNATVMGLLTRISPNLKEVSMLFTLPQSNRPMPLGPFQELHETEAKKTAGSLSSLRLKHGEPRENAQLTRGSLETWSTFIDFGHLRNLYLSTGPTFEGYRFLSTFHFKRLECLDLSISRTPGEIRPTHPPMESFLRGLSPQLRTLRIASETHLYRLPVGLGRNLRVLDLVKATTKPLNFEDVIQILVHSPQIEDLGLTIHRQKGSETEVAVYTALGKLRKLRRLRLRLKVVRPEITRGVAERLGLYNDPWLDQFGSLTPDSSGAGDSDDDDDVADSDSDGTDMSDWSENSIVEQYTLVSRLESRSCIPPEPNNSDFDDSASDYSLDKSVLLQDFFVNIAVDETLVRSIFDVISAAAGPGNTSRLQSLKVSTDGARDFEIFEKRLREYYEPWLTGWTVERDPSDHSKTGCRADNPGKWPRRSPEVLLHGNAKQGGLDRALMSVWDVQKEEKSDERDGEEVADWKGMTEEERAERQMKISLELEEKGRHPYYGPRARLDWKGFPLEMTDCSRTVVDSCLSKLGIKDRR